MSSRPNAFLPPFVKSGFTSHHHATRSLSRPAKCFPPKPKRSRSATMNASQPPSAPATTTSTASETANSTVCKPFNWMENWYPVGWTYNVPDLKPLPITIWERNYVLFRDRATGIYVVMDDVCPHRAAPLSEGRLYERDAADGKKETILECGYHGWRFGCNGRCVDIPVVSLEKRIPAAADVGGVYPTHVSVGGIIFVWLGERAKADESKIPIPKELVDVDPSDYLVFRDTFRYLPTSFSTIHENIADPAHVPFSHHGTGQGDRNKVARGGGIEILEERLDDGFVQAKSTSPNGRSSDIYFIAPTAVLYRIKLSKEPFAIYLLTWTSPTSFNRCVIYSTLVFLKPPPVLRLIQRFKPRWYEHTIGNLIFDGDTPLLHKQEIYLQKVQRDGYGGAWKKEYTLASGTWDALIVKVRQFFDTYGRTMPFLTELSENQPVEETPRRDINDRYESHTKDCVCCREALRNFKTGTVAALVGAGISGAMAVFSGIVYAALAGGGASFAPLRLQLAGGGGIVMCLLLLRLAKMLNYFRKLLTYTDISYELNHSA